MRAHQARDATGRLHDRDAGGDLLDEVLVAVLQDGRQLALHRCRRTKSRSVSFSSSNDHVLQLSY